MPLWIIKMDLADSWGMKPWEIGAVPIIWVLRYLEYMKWKAERLADARSQYRRKG